MNVFHESTVLGSRPASRPMTTPTSSTAESQPKIVCYFSEIQLKYCTVLSKPNICTPMHPQDPAKEAFSVDELGVSPRFYNVRMQCLPCEEDEEERDREEGVAESEAECKVDEQVCAGKIC